MKDVILLETLGKEKDNTVQGLHLIGPTIQRVILLYAVCLVR